VTEKQFQTAKMELGKMVNYTFPSVIRASGQIETLSKNKAKVSAYVGG
jgi:hypothetical protein